MMLNIFLATKPSTAFVYCPGWINGWKNKATTKEEAANLYIHCHRAQRCCTSCLSAKIPRQMMLLSSDNRLSLPTSLGLRINASLPLDDRIDNNITLKRRPSIWDLDLLNHCNSPKHQMMFFFGKPNAGWHALPTLETTIHCLMTCSCNIHLFQVDIIPSLVWNHHTRVSAVAAICNYFLMAAKQSFQSRPKDLNIRPRATLKGAIVGNNPSRCNANCQLIPKPRSIELVRPPNRWPRCWFRNFKVNTVNGHQASLSSMIHETIQPLDLYIKERKTAVQSEIEQRKRRLIRCMLDSQLLYPNERFPPHRTKLCPEKSSHRLQLDQHWFPRCDSSWATWMSTTSALALVVCQHTLASHSCAVFSMWLPKRRALLQTKKWSDACVSSFQHDFALDAWVQSQALQSHVDLDVCWHCVLEA